MIHIYAKTQSGSFPKNSQHIQYYNVNYVYLHGMQKGYDLICVKSKKIRSEIENGKGGIFDVKVHYQDGTKKSGKLYLWNVEGINKGLIVPAIVESDIDKRCIQDAKKKFDNKEKYI